MFILFHENSFTKIDWYENITKTRKKWKWIGSFYEAIE